MTLVRVPVILLLVALAATISRGQSGDTASTTQQTIHGIVLNSVTGKPIGRALVSLPDNRHAMLTDQEGRFEFKIPTPTAAGGMTNGSRVDPLLVNLQARKPGFQQQTMSSSTQQLGSDGTDVAVTLTLTPEAIVAGRVNLGSSDSAADVQVHLLRKVILDGRATWATVGQLSTNSKGEFRFADLPPGDYKLMTTEWVDGDPVADGPNEQHYGYPPVYYPDAPDYASAGIVHVEAGQTAQADFTLTRQPYYPVKIKIANAALSPYLNVTVNKVGAQQAPGEVVSGFALGYNQRQQQVEGELPNGTYQLDAGNNGPGGSSGSVTVTVAGAPAIGSRMVLVPNQSISVVVKGEFTNTNQNQSINYVGLPRGNRRVANVSLMAENGQASAGLRPPTGPDDTSLVIENVTPGKYVVRVDAINGYAASITSGVTDLRHEPLVIGGAGLSAPIEITLRNDFATVEGTVETEEKLPAGVILRDTENGITAYIYCVPTADSSGRYTETAAFAEGKFQITNLEPGTYRVLAFAEPQQLEYQDPQAMQAYESAGTVVSVAGGEKQHVDLAKITTTAGKE